MKTRSPRRLSRVEEAFARFSAGERLVLYGLSVVLTISAFSLLAYANAAVSVTVPALGGTFVEGEVGPARFINPIISLSQSDDDMANLVYSGLTRALPDGSIVPDLSQSYDVSEDGTTYTFKLRGNAKFHDGSPVTSADILYTVQSAQNSAIKSPRRADWEGVLVSAPDAETVVFKLPHAYAPFIENTTLGILPKHLWENVSPEEFPFSPLNTHPVGSGPYKISSLTTDGSGSATRYDLTIFKNFALGKPYLGHITLKFYSNDEAMIRAFNAREIDALARISPAKISELKRSDVRILHVPLPRIFAVFYNQNHNPALADLSARAALEAAVDTEHIVHTVLYDYGVPLGGPIPPGVLADSVPTNSNASSTSATNAGATSTPIATARSILTRGGWKFDDKSGVWKNKKLTLSLTLATADEPELLATANEVAESWRAIGVKVDVHVYPLQELNTSILRPRSYDAILFGEVVGRALDLFAFWHSSQRLDPGLNLALYTNSKADSLLSQARATTDPKERVKLYRSFEQVVEKDHPALFLYAPEFIYVVPSSLQGIALGALTSPGERYLNIHEWYIDTERVWNIFSNQSQPQ